MTVHCYELSVCTIVYANGTHYPVCFDALITTNMLQKVAFKYYTSQQCSSILSWKYLVFEKELC